MQNTPQFHWQEANYLPISRQEFKELPFEPDDIDTLISANTMVYGFIINKTVYCSEAYKEAIFKKLNEKYV